MRSARFTLAVVVLGALTPAIVGAQNPAANVNVDATANRHAIDPRVYGVAWATSTQLSDLNVPLNRQGGNTASSYNWNQNASNHANDWYFESIPDGAATAGGMGDDFITDTRAGAAQPMITIPMVGWVAKLGPGRSYLPSFSIAKYGAQTGNDWQWMPDAGNGVLTNGTYVNNDKNDANVPADATFQQGWVQHLVGRWGMSATGGLRYYILDNEHSIWHSTHRDVHPIGANMEEIRDKVLQYSAMIKGVDPGALVVGPEEFGWSGYLLSGYDLQWGDLHGWSNLPDKAAHGNMDYLPWLLNELRTHEAAGQRALDVFTVHIYPQSGEYSDDVTTNMKLLRNRSTRSLWDPSYVDESWIGDKVQLIPRLKSWASTYYHADTPVGITEYSWGAEGDMNGATAQGDVLGIFGREALDLAARWTTPAAGSPAYLSIKMYRNYDGAKSTFGETSASATGPNPDQLSTFAATRAADGALTVMVVNKALTGNTPVTVNLAHFAAGSAAHVWQLAGGSIQALADRPISGGSLTLSAPPQSLTLLVIPSTGGPTPTATATATATTRPTPTSTARPTATATVRPTATATTRPTSTMTATATFTATNTATATHPRATATMTATATATSTATARFTPTPTATASPTPTAAPGTAFYTLAPCRVLDTRNAAGPYGAPALGGAMDRTFTVAGQCGIPSGALAVSVNVTITQPGTAGDLRLFPAGAPLPVASTINFAAGQTRANNAIVTMGAGALAVRNDQPPGATVQFILDVNGYFQ